MDLEGSRDVRYDEAKKFAEENDLIFVEASAMTYVPCYVLSIGYNADNKQI